MRTRANWWRAKYEARSHREEAPRYRDRLRACEQQPLTVGETEGVVCPPLGSANNRDKDSLAGIGQPQRGAGGWSWISR